MPSIAVQPKSKPAVCLVADNSGDIPIRSLGAGRAGLGKVLLFEGCPEPNPGPG